MLSIDHHSVQQHALKTLEQADAMLASTSQLKLDEAHTIDGVVPEWLTSVLGQGVRGAAVVSVSAVDAHEGITSRHKWKLSWNKAGQD
jgi:hypothetical protein